MDGYLLDTNHVIPLLRDRHKHRESILQRIADLPAGSPICIAAATLAELEVGCCFQQQGRELAQAEIRQVIQANGLDVLPFTRHTAVEYGELKAALMRQYDREGTKNAAKWPEVWTCPTKGQPLGADEFDLIMMSHAVERNMVLVTSDPMRRIIEGLGSDILPVRFDHWAAPPTACE